jgi:hypothetical protein
VRRDVRLALLSGALAAAAAVTATACGARTGLLAPEPVDAGPDVHHHDATVDEDAPEEDALPPIDNFVPDVPIPTDCPDAGSTLVYLITEENELLSFYPPTLGFKTIGTIACPNTTATPFSMGVTRLGVAYSCFTNGRLYQVSTANASCKPTSYAPDQQGFATFCMGYAGLPDGGERLYVVDCAGGASSSLGLGWIDTQSYTLSFVGPFQPDEPACELTGTADGRLFGFCLNQVGSGSRVIQIDPTDAHVLAQNKLAVGQPNDGFAFAYWGGVFWIFTTPGGTSTVTRWDPNTQSESNVATYPGSIVGAGVSTCAPEN